MSNNAVGVVYHQLHHFLTEATWDGAFVNERRVEVMQQCNQSLLKGIFTLIRDDLGQRKIGNKTAGVGRQYIGEMGKTDNGIVVVTAHLYDGVKSRWLDVKLYQHARTLTGSKAEAEFRKKPDIALKLAENCLERGWRLEVFLVDAGYGNTSRFLKLLESKKLKYIAGVAKNIKVSFQLETDEKKVETRWDELAKRLKAKAFTAIQLDWEVPKTRWVAMVEVERSAFWETKTIAIVMNAASLSEATEVDYLIIGTPA